MARNPMIVKLLWI